MNGKKLIAMLLLVITILSASSAFAATRFSWKGRDTEDFHAWGPAQTSSGNNWHISWAVTSNMSNDLRAVVRIYANPGEYASSKFSYYYRSSEYHPYKAGYGNGLAQTYIAGRVDDDTPGYLTVLGTFHN